MTSDSDSPTKLSREFLDSAFNLVMDIDWWCKYKDIWFEGWPNTWTHTDNLAKMMPALMFRVKMSGVNFRTTEDFTSFMNLVHLMNIVQHNGSLLRVNSLWTRREGSEHIAEIVTASRRMDYPALDSGKFGRYNLH